MASVGADWDAAAEPAAARARPPIGGADRRPRYSDRHVSTVRQAEPLLSPDETRDLGLDRSALLGMYRDMLATRMIEERGNLLFKAGKLPGSYYTGRGNEGASVGMASAMGELESASPLHRNVGVHVVRGIDPAAIFCQFMGRVGGASDGRDSNLRSNDFGPGVGLLAGVSHLPAMITVITGIALAFQLRGEDRVALGWCGDGASARGDMHEAMNLAGVRKLPIVYVIDNNQFAYSTPNRLQYACEHLADRGPAYGFEGVVVDGTDVLTVYREGMRAIEKARTGDGPDGARAGDAADGRPRGARRRLLRAPRASGRVRREGSGAALPSLARAERGSHRRGARRHRSRGAGDDRRRRGRGRGQPPARPVDAAGRRVRRRHADGSPRPAILR